MKQNRVSEKDSANESLIRAGWKYGGKVSGKKMYKDPRNIGGWYTEKLAVEIQATRQ